jgi:ribosomal protein L40E/cytochrome c biogenesis protein CcdA
MLLAMAILTSVAGAFLPSWFIYVTAWDPPRIELVRDQSGVAQFLPEEFLIGVSQDLIEFGPEFFPSRARTEGAGACYIESDCSSRLHISALSEAELFQLRVLRISSLSVLGLSLVALGFIVIRIVMPSLLRAYQQRHILIIAVTALILVLLVAIVLIVRLTPVAQEFIIEERLPEWGQCDAPPLILMGAQCSLIPGGAIIQVGTVTWQMPTIQPLGPVGVGLSFVLMIVATILYRFGAKSAQAQQPQQQVESSEGIKETISSVGEEEDWNRPEIVKRWGNIVLQCPQCSAFNSIHLENCRRCSTSLKFAQKVKNPYL